MKVFKTIAVIIACAAVLIALVPVANFIAAVMADPKVSPPLVFGEDGTFKILQMSDFHAWMGVEDDTLIYIKKDTLEPVLEAYIADVLDQEQPDLVVLTGDNVFPLSTMGEIIDKISLNTYKRIAAIFEERKQYWTMTFGNHDTESVPRKPDYLKAIEPYSYFIGGTEDGDYYKQFSYYQKEGNIEDERMANFFIPVFSANNKPAYGIYLLDSGSYYARQEPAGAGYRYILPEQTAWYLETATALKEANGGKPLPSLLFTHIPLLEHGEAREQAGESIGDWLGYAPSRTRSDIFSTAFEMGDIRGIFAGHNHTNSFTSFFTGTKEDGTTHKIMMGITPQATGDRLYEGTGERDLRSRVIILKTDGDFLTYIHTSGNIIVYPNGVYKGQKMSYTQGIFA